MVKFSVVINTLNRAEYLGDALLGLRQLRYPDFEVVVVNGPSTDKTEEVLRAWEGQIKVGRCAEPNLSMSRNVGLQLSSGDVVAFIDDDAVPHPRWLDALARHYRDPNVGAVGGYTLDNTGVRFQVRKTICDRFGNAYYPGDYVDESAFCFRGSPFYPSLLGTNSSFRKTALESIGGFDHAFAYLLDETDVCLRLVDANFKVVYERNAIVFHQFAPSDLRGVNRVPKSLYPSAVSKSYFIHLHGVKFSTERAAEELKKYRDGILEANKWLFEHGDISSEHRTTLDDDLLVGIEKGRALAEEKRCVLRSESGDLMGAEPRSFKPVAHSRSLTIVFVSQSFPPHGQHGIARWTWMMARGFSDRGYKVHVVTKASKDPFTRFRDGFWVHAVREVHSEEARSAAARCGIPSGIGAWCFAVQHAVRSLKSFGVDVVSFPIWDVEGILLLKDADVAKVVSLHTTYAVARRYKPEWNERPLFAHFHVDKMIEAETEVLLKASHVLANSRSIIEEIESNYGLDLSGKVLLAPHGTLEPEGTEVSKIRDKVSRPRGERPLVVSYVGRFEERKGFDLACDALVGLLKQCSDVRVNFVGGVLDDARRNDLEGWGAGALVTDDRVVFKGEVSRRELDSVYVSSDVVIMPSRYESFGLVAIEAMAAGATVVVLRAGGLAEVVEDGVNGLCVSANVEDGRELSECLVRLYQDKALLQRLQRGARSSFEARFTVSSMVDAAEQLYVSAVGGSYQ